VLTNAGGPGVTTADAIETDGLLLAELSDATRQELADSLPAGAGLLNPVDMLASAAPQDFGRSLQILLAAPEVDGVVVVIAPPPMVSSVQVVDAMVDVIGPSPKPVLVAVLGDRTVGPAEDRLREARIPEFRFPERATAAMAVLTDRAESLASPAGSPPVPTGVDRDRAARLLAGVSSGWLGPAQSADLVAAYGIAVPSGLAATTSNEAVEALVALGGPVVLKIDHPGVVHKADRGGVRLGVSSPDEVREAFVDLAHLAGIADGSTAGPARVYVQRMVETGQDVIIGGVRDSQFGPLVMFGSGGAEVEGLEDVEFALAPLTLADVDHLLAQTWAGRRLSGYRTILPGDVTAVEAALFRIGRLISDHSNIEEIEINPLRVQSPGAGALALDVRVRVG
jgi:acetyltransferase